MTTKIHLQFWSMKQLFIQLGSTINFPFLFSLERTEIQNNEPKAPTNYYFDEGWIDQIDRAKLDWDSRKIYKKLHFFHAG